MDYLTYWWTNIVYAVFYTTYISVDLAHREIFRAKVGKCGLKPLNARQNCCRMLPLASIGLENQLWIFFEWPLKIG